MDLYDCKQISDLIRHFSEHGDCQKIYIKLLSFTIRLRSTSKPQGEMTSELMHRYYQKWQKKTSIGKDIE
jgi:hypothetical protein